MPAHLLLIGGAPSTNEVRQCPCVAGGVGPFAQRCGATPASRWERYCDNGHTREVRLCPSHARLFANGYGVCSECLDKRVLIPCAVKLRPLDLILLGHFGSEGRP